MFVSELQDWAKTILSLPSCFSPSPTWWIPSSCQATLDSYDLYFLNVSHRKPYLRSIWRGLYHLYVLSGEIFGVIIYILNFRGNLLFFLHLKWRDLGNFILESSKRLKKSMIVFFLDSEEHTFLVKYISSCVWRVFMKHSSILVECWLLCKSN